MTTTSFTPNAGSVFGFQATLDGVVYNVTVPWNVSRQGWYVRIAGASGALVLNTPLVGGVDLVGGYFGSTMTYYSSSGTFVVAP